MSCPPSSDEFRLSIQINKRYQVFDKSGKLPFSIVFGICRRSSNDTDARPLVIDTARSIFDVPWALSHGLLKLYEESANRERIEVDVGTLASDPGDARYIVVSPPVGRNVHWKQAVLTQLYLVRADSPLASLFHVGKRYAIRAVEDVDLSVKWWAYGDRTLIDGNGQPTCPPDAKALVSSKRITGRAQFTAVASLPWPPKVSIDIFPVPISRCEKDEDVAKVYLQVSATNTSDRAFTVQHRGAQHYLVPWGSMQPDDELDDVRTRILHDYNRCGLDHIQVVESTTNTIVRSGAKPPVCGGAHHVADNRPKRSALLTLEPGKPFAKQVDVSALLSKLPEGRYRMSLIPRGAWWSWGSVDEICGQDDRVVPSFYSPHIPPVKLESGDEVMVEIRDTTYTWLTATGLGAFVMVDF